MGTGAVWKQSEWWCRERDTEWRCGMRALLEPGRWEAALEPKGCARTQRTCREVKWERTAQRDRRR